jgi:Txe/YoeB family toxin of Txe-Axe toxin-antitoxin module
MSDTVGIDEETAGLTGDVLIVTEAKTRFKRCVEWEYTPRERAVADLKFVNGDPDNGWQWPDELLSSRDLQAKVSLTLNKTRVHCLQIENEARKNKPSVKIRPTGNGATYEASQVFEGIVRHIEYISRAQNAYMTASRFQIRTGIGYVRLVTDYVGPDTFDQEIFIRRVKDPTTVYLDPDINEEDGSDARFGFVYDDMPKDEFRNKYPKFTDVAASSALGDGIDSGWIGEDHVRVCEYFRRTEKTDTLIQAIDPATGEIVRGRKSKLPPDVWKALDSSLDKKTRDIVENKVEWFTIAGSKIIDRRDWLGEYIPIARVVGEETIVEKKLDRKGHVRPMKDAQRQYNFWASATTESVAMQPIQPWLIDPQSIEELESVWATANTKKHAYLPWKKWDDEGRELPAPVRVAPPMIPEALIKGMQIAETQLMMVSGQYQAQMGENENAKSGRAIQERQAQGDNATYHFNDGMATMIRFVGKMLIDLIPKVYDTKRVVKILAEDNSEEEVEVDPQAKQAYFKKQGQDTRNVQAIFNPNVGTYEVEADIGPDYATRRQEAYNALTQLMASNKDLLLWAGDLLMKVCDFPMADELAERLRRMVPPQALGEAPPAQIQEQMQHLSQQNQSLQNLVTELTKKIAEDAIKIKSHAEQKDIDVMDAESRRITAVSNAIPEVGKDDARLIAVIQKTLHEMQGSDPGADVVAANAPELTEGADA